MVRELNLPKERCVEESFSEILHIPIKVLEERVVEERIPTKRHLSSENEVVDEKKTK